MHYFSPDVMIAFANIVVNTKVRGDGTLRTHFTAMASRSFAVIRLMAAVVAVPLFRAAGFGAVPGFLIAGVLVGP